MKKISKNDLSDLQLQKLNLAAKILKETSHLFDGISNNILSLWGGGVITHGIPKIKKCIIGITENARSVEKSETTKDHLYRVTETARYLLNKINQENIGINKIETILLERSAQMITTKYENRKILRDALKKCKNKDSCQELYEIAGIRYHLY